MFIKVTVMAQGLGNNRFSVEPHRVTYLNTAFILAIYDVKPNVLIDYHIPREVRAFRYEITEALPDLLQLLDVTQ